MTEGNQGYQTDAQLVKAKLIIPLDKYVKKYGWDKLYAPSTWGMFRWTPDGKSFGKGPIWGIAQTGQNVVVFYNKKKFRQAGLIPNRWPSTYAGFEAMLATLRAKLPYERPRDRGGQQGGLGLHPPVRRHLGRELQKPSAVRNWIYHVPGSRFDTPGTITALGPAPAVGEERLLQRRLQRDQVRRRRHSSSRRARARCGSAATGTRPSSRRVSAPRTSASCPCRPGPRGQWTSIGGLSGPWHISAKTKNADLGAEWLNYVITSTQAKRLMFGQQQLPGRQERAAAEGRRRT